MSLNTLFKEGENQAIHSDTSFSKLRLEGERLNNKLDFKCLN